jgi:hypothetical protein
VANDVGLTVGARDGVFVGFVGEIVEGGDGRKAESGVGFGLGRSVDELVGIAVGFGVALSTGGTVGLAVGGRGGKGSVIALESRV